MPLPRTISREMFEFILSSCGLRHEEGADELVALAHHWYHLDNNNIPPVYVLKDLTDLDDKSYWDAFPKLSRLFDGVLFESDVSLTDHLLVGRSVTEWEVKAAVLKEDDPGRVVWFNRTFDKAVTEQDKIVFSKDYNDHLKDDECDQKFNNLISWMMTKIPADKRYSYNKCSYSSYVAKDDDWKSQIHQWTEDVSAVLTESLQRVIRCRHAWLENAFQLGIYSFTLSHQFIYLCFVVDRRLGKRC